MPGFINIQVNGQQQSVSAGTLAEWLHNLQIRLEFSAIAVNNEVIPSADYAKTRLHDGDHIEIVSASCGG